MPSNIIDKHGLKRLVKEDQYQVFLLTSSIPFPFGWAVHAWFVVQLNGELNRYEFGKFKGSPNPNGIGLLKNYFKPTTGMNRYWWQRRDRYPAKLISTISGDEKSVAARIIAFLEVHSEKYPHKEMYRYLGPNSNTYCAWVLKHFPDSGLKLPISAVGKNYPSQKLFLKMDNTIKLVDIRP